jgi:transposase
VNIGVDTHKKTHVLVAVGEQGQTLGTRTVANTPEGWATALQWARGQQQQQTRWGVENSGSLGKGFAQFLLAQGEAEVREVVPHRTAQYRRRGRTQDKTDTADALAMARLLCAEGEALPRVQADDASTELRLLSDYRDNLVADRTRLINQLHAQMLQLDPRYEERAGPLTRPAGVRYCQEFDPPHADGLMQARLLIVRQLATRIAALTTGIADRCGGEFAGGAASGRRSYSGPCARPACLSAERAPHFRHRAGRSRYRASCFWRCPRSGRFHAGLT